MPKYDVAGLDEPKPNVMRRRKVDYGGETVAYSIRNLRVTTLDRVRLLATRWDCSIEQAINVLLVKGCEEYEK